jgi:Ni/Fe-hydrogenase subunit HybB-like protein
MAGDLSPPSADPLLLSGQSYRSIGRDVAGITFDHPGNKRWWIAFAGAMGLAGLLVIALGYLFYEGPGIWGNNIPVTWALDIVSYDWWIGIACGGLTVSATLLLLGLAWRGALNRITETMALISAIAAALYPIIHLGRPWFFFWTLPYPNTLLLWPQWRSPLVWDAVNIISFLLVCLSFWYIGLLPDLASLRDRAIARTEASPPGRPHKWHLFRAQLYGIAALGWRGSATHWQRWAQAYRMVGLFGILLVVSLQTGSALEFASSLEPGWHDTMLPVAHFFSALFEGVGAVAALTVLLRSVYSLELVITERHLDLLGKLLLGLCIVNLYCYACEFLIASQFGTDYNKAVLARRFAGPNAWSSWVIIGCALAPVQLFWLRFMRRSPPILLIVGLLVTAGMWADHFMVIVITLQQDFLPSSANRYSMDFWGLATFAGSGGLFLVLLLLAFRFLPVVSIHEVRRLVRPGEDPDHV